MTKIKVFLAILAACGMMSFMSCASPGMQTIKVDMVRPDYAASPHAVHPSPPPQQISTQVDK